MRDVDLGAQRLGGVGDRAAQRGRVAVQGEHDAEHEPVGDDHLLDVEHLDVVGGEGREEGRGDAGSVVSGDGDEDGVWMHEEGSCAGVAGPVGPARSARTGITQRYQSPTCKSQRPTV